MQVFMEMLAGLFRKATAAVVGWAVYFKGCLQSVFDSHW